MSAFFIWLNGLLFFCMWVAIIVAAVLIPCFLLARIVAGLCTRRHEYRISHDGREWHAQYRPWWFPFMWVRVHRIGRETSIEADYAAREHAAAHHRQKPCTTIHLGRLP